MDSCHLPELADELLRTAREAAHGRSAKGLLGGHGHVLRQIVMALRDGSSLDEHDSPEEGATLQVLQGRIRLSTATDSWEGAAGDHLVIPHERHDVLALEDAVFILTVAVLQR